MWGCATARYRRPGRHIGIVLANSHCPTRPRLVLSGRQPDPQPRLHSHGCTSSLLARFRNVGTAEGGTRRKQGRESRTAAPRRLRHPWSVGRRLDVTCRHGLTSRGWGTCRPEVKQRPFFPKDTKSQHGRNLNQILTVDHGGQRNPHLPMFILIYVYTADL